MPLEIYHFNLTTREWVNSVDDPSPIRGGFPEFGHTDTRSFAMRYVRSVGSSSVEVATEVTSAQIALSDPATPSTVITSATSGAAENNYFPFLLPIAGFSTFLSGVLDRKLARCEFRIVEAGIGNNRYRTGIYISPNQTTDATADPTLNDRALGAEEAQGIYVPKIWPAGMTQIVTTASGRQFLNYPGDDGQWHLDPI